ncbi:MAG: PhnD/SsuA/transferrin family substrate-binding protein [Actinomycetota bacterium]
MTPIASLPMYDWPEVVDALDRFWTAIRSSLDELGVAVPDARIRPTESVDHWRDPSLLISQTCGLPLRRHLLDDVAVIGSFDHRLPATPAGHYHSVVVVAESHPAASLVEFDAATAAVNGAESQSGHAALRHALIAHPGAVTAAIRSGSHRDSVRMVADGLADVAAIDAVSWELAVAHEPAAARCRVLQRTAPTPGLPLVTARANTHLLPHLRLAVAHGVSGLAEDDRRTLHTHALIAADADDYAVLDRNWADADVAGVAELV